MDLINQGYCVDTLSIWEGSDPENAVELNVDLSQLDESAFRLFENHHFVYHASRRPENPSCGESASNF